MFVRHDPIADADGQRLLDAVAAPIFCLDGRGRCSYINPAAASLFGYAVHQLLGQCLTRLVLARGEGRLFSAVLSEEDPPSTGTARFTRRDGTTFKARYSCVPLGGAALAVSLEAIVEEPAAVEEYASLFFEQALPPIVFFAADGRILKANAAARLLWGEKDFEDPSYSLLGDPKLIASGWLPQVLKAFAGETATLPPIAHGGNGQQWFQAILCPIRDPDGSVNALALVYHDVSALKHAEQLACGQIEALVTTLNTLAANPTLDSFLGQVLTTIATQLKAPLAEFWLTDFEHDLSVMHFTSYQGRIWMGADQPDHPGARGIPLALAREQECYQQVYVQRRPYQLKDIAALEQGGQGPLWDDFRRWAAARGVQTKLVVPLVLGEQVIGAFSFCDNEPRVYTAQEIELVQAIAHQATLAVQLTRLAEQKRHSAVLEERNRMARELHDTLMQSLAGIVIQLQAALDPHTAAIDEQRQHIEQARQLARQSLAEARRSVQALRPQQLEENRLDSALEALPAQASLNTSVQIDCQIEGTPYPLVPDVEHHLLRIAAEALSNALQHAQARQVRVLLAYRPEQVHLSIADDGRGFDPHAHRPERFGLVGMAERAQQIAARLTIDSAPGQGTHLSVVLKRPS